MMARAPLRGDSSAGWKSSRTRPGRLALAGEVGEHQAGAEHGGGVHVVPAGVADTRDGRGVGHVLAVEQRQRVDVRAQRHDRLAVADVADQPGAVGQHLWLEARRDQALPDHRGGALLLPGQLGVRVQVATQRDELVGVGLDHGGEGREQLRLDAHRVRSRIERSHASLGS